MCISNVAYNGSTAALLCIKGAREGPKHWLHDDDVSKSAADAPHSAPHPHVCVHECRGLSPFLSPLFLFPSFIYFLFLLSRVSFLSLQYIYIYIFIYFSSVYIFVFRHLCFSYNHLFLLFPRSIHLSYISTFYSLIYIFHPQFFHHHYHSFYHYKRCAVFAHSSDVPISNFSLMWYTQSIVYLLYVV